MASRPTYVLRLEPLRGVWHVEVRHCGLRTTARSLARAEALATAAMADQAGKEPGSYRFRRRYVFGQDTDYDVLLYHHGRRTGEGDQAALLAEAVYRLTLDGVSASDIAEILRIDGAEAARLRAASGVAH